MAIEGKILPTPFRPRSITIDDEKAYSRFCRTLAAAGITAGGMTHEERVSLLKSIGWYSENTGPESLGVKE